MVCAAGYEIDADCLAITGQYNKIKIVSNDTEENSWIVRVTKIKSDLSIVITPKVHVDGINGYEITFALTHATAKVYVGPKDETGSNVDAGEEGKFYTRDKVAPYGYSKTEPQFNFEIIPEEGYEFNDVKLYQSIDGDTAHFIPLVTTTSRLNIKSRYYGIDTPESTGRIQPWGQPASDFIEGGEGYAEAALVTQNDIAGRYYNSAVFPGSATLRKEVGSLVTNVLNGKSALDDAFATAINNAKKDIK